MAQRNTKKTNLSLELHCPENARKVAALQSGYESGTVSRREFVTGVLALGVSVGAATAVVDEVAAATPKKGGVIRVALTGGATSDSLDPGQILDLYMINLQFGQLRNGLTEVAADGSLIGELAESWEASANADTWHFKIRKDVEFHNGKTLDATDVAASLNHHLTEDSTSAAKGILSGIMSVKADGKHDVVVKLDGGDADFPFILSDYHLGICPANADGTIDWQSGTGTGGYILNEHEPGVQTRTTRNPNYWKQGMAHFDEVEIYQVADQTARTSGVQSGQFQAMNNVDVKTEHLLNEAPGINVISTTGNKQITLPMRTDTPPFTSNDVRLAVKYIVDREQWLKLIMRGHGELGNDNPIGPANIYRATEQELPQRQYDPEKAKYHLKQAGMSTLKLQFHAAETGFPGAVNAAQLMRESAHKAGIDIEIIREPDDGYWSNVWMQKAFVACYWSGRPTENWMFSQVYASDASWNDTFWQHKRFNDLLLMGRAELDPSVRREIYVEMQQIIHHEGGVCLPLFLPDLMAVSDKIGMPEHIGNNWELDGGKFNERWWYKDAV